MDKLPISKLARRISMRQLQVFESVGRLCSFTGAAHELHLTQPTVSMQIKKLEDDIGVPLTEQIGKKISLTEAGQELLSASREILLTLSRYEMIVDDQKGLRTGHLRLAVVSTANYFAPRILGYFYQAYPGIKVSLEVANRTQILERMNNNLDDLYLIGEPPKSSELEFKPYLDNPMVVVAPVNHPLAKKKRIPITELADEYFIMREKGSGTRIAAEERFAKAGVEMKIRLELGNNESIKQGISGGLGLAVLSLHTLTQGDSDELTMLDVEGFPVSWQWYIGHPKGKKLSVVTKTFIDYMYDKGPSLLPETIKAMIAPKNKGNKK